MPRTSKRKCTLNNLQRTLVSRRHSASVRYLLKDDDGFEDEIDDQLELLHEQVNCTRYTFRSNKYRKRKDKWNTFLDANGEFNDEEFIGHFRMSRGAFAALVNLVRKDPVFKPKGRREFRGGPTLHVLILLKFLGSFGNENTSPKLAHFFGIGKGSVKNYVWRACHALLKLRDSTITWPDNEERQLIAARIQEKYAFVNCIGLMDGTLLPLEFKPKRNGEDYFSRKGGYSLNALVICDDVARIRDFVVGWPGSVHDNRVWTTSTIYRNPDTFFTHNQYRLGDSAFQPSPNMIPAFKKPPRSELDAHRKYFNTKLAKARIKTEHCIGLAKTRFQYLRGIGIKLSGKKIMKRLIRLDTCAFFLHNLLIFEPIPDKWKKDIIANGDGLDADDELNLPIGRSGRGDERCKQLFNYLLEIRG